MSPTTRVALSSALGAVAGGFGGFLIALAGSAIAGAGPGTRGRSTAVALGIGTGASVGAATLGAIVEHKQLQQAGA